MKQTESADSRPTLNYAPPKRRFRRPIMWTMIGLFAIILTLPLTMQLWHWADARLELRGLQNACRNFRAAPDVVVFDDHVGEMPFPSHPAYDGWWVSGYQGDDGSLYQRHMQSVSALDILARRNGSSWSPSATLFVHERVSPGGKRAIVGITTWGIRFGTRFDADVVVIQPAPFLGTAQPTGNAQNVVIGAWPSRETMVRLYAGQPDPTEASRFTIAYQFGDQPGIIDGQLNDDLTVTLTPRTGPLTSPGR